MVVLKRLGDALRDRDRVLAVIRGTAVNQDGAQRRADRAQRPRAASSSCVRRCGRLDCSPATSTTSRRTAPAPRWVTRSNWRRCSQVFGERNGAAPLVLGSVKTNLGHLESAAGVAGFIKTVLSVRNSYIPRQLHFTELTPRANAAARFTIAAEPLDWPATDRPRRAGVSSFGVSGTNAHVVVEQAPATEPAENAANGARVPLVSTLVVSGKTPPRVGGRPRPPWRTGSTATAPKSALPDIAHTLNHHRARHPHVGDRDAPVTVLRRWWGCGRWRVVIRCRVWWVRMRVCVGRGRCLCFRVRVRSGRGWVGRCWPRSRLLVLRWIGWSRFLLSRWVFRCVRCLLGGQPVAGIDRIQPVLVGVQLALAQLWQSYGVVPDAVIGHSMGEVAAAVVAGALTAAQGLRVIATRSRLMAGLSGQGAMALLELDAQAAGLLVADYPQVSVAVYASPSQTVIAGPPDAVDAVVAVVAGRDRLARRVEVDVASHHRTVDPILPALGEALADLVPAAPSIPVISTVGEYSGALFGAEYWVANLRQPVRFSQAVTAAGTQAATFVEISPHPLLTHAISDTLGGVHHHTVATLQRDTDDTLTFHTALNAAQPTRVRDLPHPPEPHPALPDHARGSTPGTG